VSDPQKIRVAILYGGRSAEHEVSVVSARSMMAAIDRTKYEVVPIAITKQGRWLLPARTPDQLEAAAGTLPGTGDEGRDVTLVREGGEAALRPLEGGSGLGAVDVVFPVLHGPYGEDGTVQGLLELAGVPYVGAGVLASALGMDKEMQKQLFNSRGLHVVPYIHVHVEDWRRSPDRIVELAEEEIGFPCFTKPANLGSSLGISKCRTIEELRAGLETALSFDRKALVERAITARELECGVLGNDEPEVSIVGEVVPHREFYDFEAKYIEEGSELRIPAPIPEETSEEVRRMAVEAFRAIDCAGMARVDFFYEVGTGTLYLNEVNTIPGFTPISMYPKLWEASGVPYAKLLDRLIELALERRDPRG
jgi:D-alanine-D-alanine ligase